MREIKYIVVHCTATPKRTSLKSILNYWKTVKKWKYKGYHFIITAFGFVNYIQDIKIPSNGVRGYNKYSIHVAYIGGVDKYGKPKDTRTAEQKKELLSLLGTLSILFPKAKILGHRDFPNVKKACPSFDAKTEYSNIKTF